MKRSQASLAALTLFSGAAYSQSNVTLYGVLDANIEYVSNISQTSPTVNPTTGQVNAGPAGNKIALSSGGLSAARWGLRGIEDLGGGMQAVFSLENGFGVDDGKQKQGGRLFGRQAFVGLSSNFGTITFGRQMTALSTALGNYSPTAFAYQYEPVDVMTGVNYRSDNTVKYVGTFGGLTGVAHWTFGNGAAGAGEVPGQFRRDSGYGAGLSYDSGPFGVSLAYDQYDPTINAATGATGKFRKAASAVKYSFKRGVVMAGYRWEKNLFPDDSTTLRDDFWWIGGNYEVLPALTLTLAYYYQNMKTLKLVPTAQATNPANPWQVSFMADYSLSKRTDIYLTAAYAKNAGLALHNATLGFANIYALGQGKNSMTGVAAGLRHKF